MISQARPHPGDIRNAMHTEPVQLRRRSHTGTQQNAWRVNRPRTEHHTSSVDQQIALGIAGLDPDGAPPLKSHPVHQTIRVDRQRRARTHLRPQPCGCCTHTPSIHTVEGMRPHAMCARCVGIVASRNAELARCFDKAGCPRRPLLHGVALNRQGPICTMIGLFAKLPVALNRAKRG